MKEFTESKHSEKAIEAVQKEQPKGTNFSVPYIFADDFYGGTLAIVRFSVGGQDMQNSVFFDMEGRVGVYYRTEDLAKALSGRKALGPFARFMEETGITGIIAILITLTIVYLVVKDPVVDVPEVLSNALTIIIGFYFGTKVKSTQT